MFKHILLIDDDDIVNYFHKYIIQEENITNEVISTNDVIDAMEKIKELNTKTKEELFPSLILLDINMPMYSGFELVEKCCSFFKELNQKGVFLMILSTSENPNDIEKAKSIPLIQKYLTKPLNVNSLKVLTKDYAA